MPKPAVTTSDRVLEASLKLFNEQGLANVSALAVAKHLGISSGNLAYHFKGKNGIVTAILKRLEIDMRKVLLGVAKPGVSFLPGDAATYHVQVIQTLWRYRFFFNALAQLLTHDAAMRKRFMRLQNNIVDAIKGVFDALIVEGQMNDPPFSTQLLAKSCWMIWLSWPRFEQIDNPDDEVVRNVAIYNGTVQSFVVVQSYFSRSFTKSFFTKLARQLLVNAGPVSTGMASPKIIQNARGRAATSKRRHATA
jgi:AcrR family transcriptional regulator